MLRGLGARVHVFARPENQEELTSLFRDVLGCKVVERDFGLAHPILFVSFSDGSGFSVEFSENVRVDAPCGTWIEFRAQDAEKARQALRSAGVPEFRHAGSTHAYFSAPGGQVFRILDLDYAGP